MKKVVEVETSTTAVIASTEESSIDFDTVKVTNDEPVKNVTPPPQQETTTAAAPAYETEEEEGGGDSSAISWLRDVLSPAGLESFANALVNTIGVEDKEDLKDVVRADLESIGMSSEEQEAFQKLRVSFHTLENRFPRCNSPPPISTVRPPRCACHCRSDRPHRA